MGHVCQEVCLDLVTHLGEYRGGQDRPQPGSAQTGLPKACPSSQGPSPPLGEGQRLQPTTNFSHAGIVNEARIGTGTSYDESWPEEPSSEGQLLIVNEASLGLDRQTKS